MLLPLLHLEWLEFFHQQRGTIKANKVLVLFVICNAQRLKALQQQLIPKIEDRLRRKCEELVGFHHSQPDNGKSYPGTNKDV